MNPMPTFAAYINNDLVGYVRAVSLKQAKARARLVYRTHRVDLIGICAPKERAPAMSSLSNT